MEQNEIISKIELRLKDGLSKDAIYLELGGSDDVARLLASTPTFENREKYKNTNNVLIVLIMFFAICKALLTVFIYVINDTPLIIFPLALFVPIVAVFFAKEVKNFRGYIYFPVFLLGLAVIFLSFDSKIINYNSINWTVWFLIYTPVFLSMAISIYLKKRLCPNLGYFGAKTDRSGKYLL